MADAPTPITQAPNRASRRKAAKGRRKVPDRTVLDAINRAKSGGRNKPPDGAAVIEPTPEQIAAAQDAFAAQNAGQAPSPGMPPMGGDMPPLDPSQMDPAVLKQLEEMSGGGLAAGSAAQALAQGRKKRAKKYVDLEAELAVFLMMPAVPCEMAGDTFCANHFAQQGPMLAHRLVAYAETHDATFELLCKITQAGGMVTLIVAVAAYALPPMLHHGMPGPEGLKRMYHVPPKAPEPQEVEPNE